MLAAAAAQGDDLANPVLGMQNDHPLPKGIGIDVGPPLTAAERAWTRSGRI
jgi:hypothetical protein